MKNYLLIFTLFLSFYACKEDKKVPEYIWEEDRFIEVLTEFQMAEATIRLGYHRNTDSLFINDSIYNAALRKVNATQAEFDSNYNYYLKDPEVLEKMYEKVITNLSERSASLKNDKAEKPAPPSLSK